MLFDDEHLDARLMSHRAIESVSHTVQGAGGIVDATLIAKLVEKLQTETDDIKVCVYMYSVYYASYKYLYFESYHINFLYCIVYTVVLVDMVVFLVHLYNNKHSSLIISAGLRILGLYVYTVYCAVCTIQFTL